MSEHSIATQHRETSQGWTAGHLPNPTAGLPSLPTQPQTKPRIGIGRMTMAGLMVGFFCMVAVELAGIPGFSPMAKVGESVSRFLEERNQGQMRVQICLAKQQEISQRLAKLEADYAEWKGTCGALEYGAAMIDPSFGRMLGGICSEGSGEYYQSAISDLHHSKAELEGCRP